MESRIILLELPDVRPLMHRTTVPDNDHGAAQVFEELSHEPSDGNMVEIIVNEIAEVQTEAIPFWRQRQGADHGDLVAASATMPNLVKELRGLPLEGQRATNQRRHEETALVDKEQMSP